MKLWKLIFYTKPLLLKNVKLKIKLKAAKTNKQVKCSQQLI